MAYVYQEYYTFMEDLSRRLNDSTTSSGMSYIPISMDGTPEERILM